MALLLQTAAQDRLPSLATGAGDYMRVMLVLAAVLILAYAAMRFLAPRMAGMGRISSGSLKIVARLPLEPRKNLYVVQAGSAVLLIGASEQQIHFLTSLDPTDAEAVGRTPRSARVPPDPPPDGDSSASKLDFHRLLERAGRMRGE